MGVVPVTDLATDSDTNRKWMEKRRLFGSIP